MWKRSVLTAALFFAGAAQASEQPGYVLATEKGIFRIDTQGRVQKKLSSTEATAPIFLPTKSCLDLAFLHTATDGAIELRQLRLTDGHEESIATIPAFSYADFLRDGGKDKLRLGLASEAALVVGESGICLHLMDRNLNMARYEASVQIDFKTHAVRVLQKGCSDDDCKPEQPFRGALSSACSIAASSQCSRSVATSTLPYPFRVTDQKLLALEPRGKDKERVAAELKDGSDWGWLAWGAASRSGRWQILEGNLDSGTDSLLRQALLLDRRLGLLYPLPQTQAPRLGQPLPWPRPLSKKQLQTLNDAASLRTLTLSSTSTLRTLEHEDQLLVDGWLITPGKQLVYLGGDLAD